MNLITPIIVCYKFAETTNWCSVEGGKIQSSTLEFLSLGLGKPVIGKVLINLNKQLFEHEWKGKGENVLKMLFITRANA